MPHHHEGLATGLDAVKDIGELPGGVRGAELLHKIKLSDFEDKRYPLFMGNQIVIQLSEVLAQRLDEKAEEEGRSRLAVALDAIEKSLTSKADRDEITRQIIDGYKRIPQTDEEPW